jgi:hypothetical protein
MEEKYDPDFIFVEKCTATRELRLVFGAGTAYLLRRGMARRWELHTC